MRMAPRTGETVRTGELSPAGERTTMKDRLVQTGEGPRVVIFHK